MNYIFREWTYAYGINIIENRIFSRNNAARAALKRQEIAENTCCEDNIQIRSYFTANCLWDRFIKIFLHSRRLCMKQTGKYRHIKIYSITLLRVFTYRQFVCIIYSIAANPARETSCAMEKWEKPVAKKIQSYPNSRDYERLRVYLTSEISFLSFIIPLYSLNNFYLNRITC